MDQIRRQASESAISIVSRLVEKPSSITDAGRASIVGKPIVSAIIVTETDRD